MDQVITIDGYDIAYRVVGKGSQVAVMVHGWGASKAWWQIMAEGLAETHTCYLIDLLGFGASTKPDTFEPFQIEHQAAMVAGLIQQLELAPVYLIGHSMGGMITVTLAHHYPALVDRFTVFNLVVTGRCGSFLQLGGLITSLPFIGSQLYRWTVSMNTSSLTMYSNMFKEMLVQSRNVKRPDIHQFVVRTFADVKKTPAHSYEFALKAFTTFDLRPFMGQVEQPALVVGGKEDRQIPPEDTQLLADALPNGQLKWFSPAGHDPFVEYPDQCIALLKEFGQKAL
ncbi:MAG: alpha/beta hydrolase [Chloroflexota bacterium]